MGISELRGKKSLVHELRLPVPISVSKVQAPFRDLVVPRQINLTSGRRAKRLHQYPACGGRGQEDETILICGFSGHGFQRFVYQDPPGLIRSWKI